MPPRKSVAVDSSPDADPGSLIEDSEAKMRREVAGQSTVGTAHTASLPSVARLLRLSMRTGLRGQTRATFFLARHLTALQAVPIPFHDRGPVFVDLRLGGAHQSLAGAPWSSAPFETAEQAVLTSIARPGDVAFDIGANIGLHTGLLSRLVGAAGRVYAFEPNPQIARCLEKTVGALSNGHLYRVALSDEESQAVLYVPVDHSMASLADWTVTRSVGATLKVTCPQVRLDDVVQRDGLPAPDLIKCDVEGAELKVFRGAYRTLNRVEAPAILFEADVHTARGFNLSVSAAKNFLAALLAAGVRVLRRRRGRRVVPRGRDRLRTCQSSCCASIEERTARERRVRSGIATRAHSVSSADASTATGIVKEASGNSVMHTRSNHREAHLTEFDRSLAKTHQFTSATVRSHVQHNCVLPEKPESASDSSNSVVEWIRSLSE